MNVFEDLIEELREENLLENTVIEVASKNETTKASSESVAEAQSNGDVTDQHQEDADPDGSEDREQISQPTGSPAEGEGEKDFFRKRAMDEVASLQMVEHVLTGIEREHMKIVPGTYDDLQAKKALHRFLQVQSDPSTSEYAEAEFQLMHETEAWNSALAVRDERVNVSSLRRYCENSRPALSSQAMMALSRFYRNAPFSELARSKFDLIMTRLFSRNTGDEKRRLLFPRTEMVGHIKTLYANWASVALYTEEDLPLKSREVVAGFEEHVREISMATSFEELVESTYFKRIHEYKVSIGELFYTPEVMAAAIDCNIRVGNKFVDLIHQERELTDTETVETKYGYQYDQIISEAAGKTLHLVELLKSLPTETAEDNDFDAVSDTRPTPPAAREKLRIPVFSSSMFQVNKWLLLATIMAVLCSAGLYYWSNNAADESGMAESAIDVSLESSPLKEYLRSGRATTESFYAITLPAWDQLTDDEKKEILKQAFEFANRNGQRKMVQLVNVRGRTVAYASAERSELINAAN